MTKKNTKPAANPDNTGAEPTPDYASVREHPYASFVREVEKPARYLGGEYQQVVKDWDGVDTTFCMGFPDVYDIGMSHLGTKILYSVVNKADDLLMERAFCPWIDMEAQLRKRDVPLLSLETHRPLVDFDVVGFSLQYEMTFTNVLTMMDLGGIPIHNDERTLDDPLVIAGGPTCTHPEPMAPFIDVFLIGDAEERLPRLLRHWSELKKEGGRTREEMIAELVREGGLYAPDLYETTTDDRTGFEVVSTPKYDGVPARVERAFLDDISKFRFPDDSPVAVAEAIFDRMSVEIARGCTEGCRFCQAGMIYRPVRERDPDEIVETVLSAIEKGGYDEASLTSLSTADFSCVSPLVKKVMDELRPRKVSLGISSLRAYGLDEDLLDEIQSVKATGLTFAPEAGTQRMRDVINKNITEDDIFTTCHRVFERGWNRMKLYFIIGLPTEEDEDVLGIADMGKQALAIGKEHSNRVAVTVSVSSHVPKPHTPFQWAAMDTIDEIKRKQKLLIDRSREDGFKFRRHDMHVSHIEGIIARGDRRTAWVVEEAWKRGARFDSWDEQLNLDAWFGALDDFEETFGVSRRHFLDTIPLDGRLPWDHIDVGLEDKFLVKEYKKAVASRLSPPCGKPFGAKVHHTNLADAHAEKRKLVCYHCGIACDLTEMREERIEFLEKLGADERRPREAPTVRENALERVKKGLAPHDFGQGEKHTYRLQYTRLGAVALQGHLDMVRVIPRVFRRAGLEVYYSQGYSPKPVMSFSPALPLGAKSISEFVDISLVDPIEPTALLELLNPLAPTGLCFTGAREVLKGDDALSKRINRLEFVLAWDRAELAASLDVSTESLDTRIEQLIAETRTMESLPVTVVRKRRRRSIDLMQVVDRVDRVEASDLPPAFEVAANRPAIRIRTVFGEGAALKPHEVAEAVLGSDVTPVQTLRVDCALLDDAGERSCPLASGVHNEATASAIRLQLEPVLGAQLARDRGQRIEADELSFGANDAPGE